ncbi:type II secretion system protein GspH [Pseudoxanthomonas yeongjuensis]|jgi:general secretion pathway protein H|uniref:type II secretion system protein XpsH n=1 Tax=Pseudoxanthomonas yeongjuensis TaxID=377616 RepID=UPI00139158CA|nr:type II secretion system protein GspH [Pseudoxanthomonas yeongjuensis]
MKSGVHPCASGRAPGFTLLEVLVVLIIIAMATTLAAMVFSGGLDGMRLRSSSKEIAAQLRYTRTQAIASGQPQRFTIDPRGHRWQAAGNRQGKIPPSLGVDFIGAREVQPRAGEGGILFFPDGASTGGRVRLSVKRAAWRIDVSWLTGEVTLARASPGDASP